MTVMELIELLGRIKDKQKLVRLSTNSALVDARGEENFIDQPHQLLIR
jgi:hypothetical protein